MGGGSNCSIDRKVPEKRAANSHRCVCAKEMLKMECLAAKNCLKANVVNRGKLWVYAWQGFAKVSYCGVTVVNP
jgi:hypothetical protein